MSTQLEHPALHKTFGIKPIRTFYGGHYYLSKTEAYWAVFMDVLGIPFRYEDQGFVIRTELDEICYLPDFFIPPIVEAWPQWIECKGVLPTADEIAKLIYVCRALSCDGILCVGRPDLCGDLLWCVRDASNEYQLQWMKQDFLSKLFGDTDRAFLIARSYRFNYGHDLARATLQRMYA